MPKRKATLPKQEGEKVFLNDGEVCHMLRLSSATLRRLITKGPPNRKHGAVDLRLAEPVKIGGARRWNAAKLATILEM